MCGPVNYFIRSSQSSRQRFSPPPPPPPFTQHASMSSPEGGAKHHLEIHQPSLVGPVYRLVKLNDCPPLFQPKLILPQGSPFCWSSRDTTASRGHHDSISLLR